MHYEDEELEESKVALPSNPEKLREEVTSTPPMDKAQDESAADNSYNPSSKSERSSSRPRELPKRNRWNLKRMESVEMSPILKTFSIRPFDLAVKDVSSTSPPYHSPPGVETESANIARYCRMNSAARKSVFCNTKFQRVKSFGSDNSRDDSQAPASHRYTRQNSGTSDSPICGGVREDVRSGLCEDIDLSAEQTREATKHDYPRSVSCGGQTRRTAGGCQQRAVSANQYKLPSNGTIRCESLPEVKNNKHSREIENHELCQDLDSFSHSQNRHFQPNGFLRCCEEGSTPKQGPIPLQTGDNSLCVITYCTGSPCPHRTSESGAKLVHSIITVHLDEEDVPEQEPVNSQTLIPITSMFRLPLVVTDL